MEQKFSAGTTVRYTGKLGEKFGFKKVQTFKVTKNTKTKIVKGKLKYIFKDPNSNGKLEVVESVLDSYSPTRKIKDAPKAKAKGKMAAAKIGGNCVRLNFAKKRAKTAMDNTQKRWAEKDLLFTNKSSKPTAAQIARRSKIRSQEFKKVYGDNTKVL